MLQSLDGRWKALLFISAAFLCLLAFNIAISQTRIDISPLPIMVSTSIPSAKSIDIEHSPLFADLALPETLARPVFSPTRRDFVEAPPMEQPVETVLISPPETAPSLPFIQLKGTRTINGKLSALIVADEEIAEWFGEGESITGWTIVSITTDRLSLSDGVQSIGFSLYETGKAEADDIAQ